MSQHAAGAQLAAGEEVGTRAFRDTMGAFVTGVTVVTTADGGEPYGVTVSAFCSLSLDPLLVLVCLADRGHGRDLIERSGAFTVNVLAEDQAHLSAFFASSARPRGRSALCGVPARTGVNGCPVLTGVAAHVECRVRELVPGGDHVVVIGEVLALSRAPQARPLLFAGGRYHAVGDAMTARTAVTVAPPAVSRSRLHAL